MRQEPFTALVKLFFRSFSHELYLWFGKKALFVKNSLHTYSQLVVPATKECNCDDILSNIFVQPLSSAEAMYSPAFTARLRKSAWRLDRGKKNK